MKTSYFIPQQVPQFVLAEYPAFVDFIKAYYEWFDQQSLGSMSDLLDIDNTIDDFIRYFKKELDETGVLSNIDNRFYLRNIKQLYRAKGSKASYKFLFRLLYNTEADVEHPWDYTFKPSAGKWKQDTSTIIQITKGDGYLLGGNFIYITDKNGKKYTTFVYDVVKRAEGVFQLFIDRFNCEAVRFVSITTADGSINGNVLLSVGKAVVEIPGQGFELGQVFEAYSIGGSETYIKVKAVDKKGGIKAVEIIAFGYGYQSDFNMLLLPSQAIKPNFNLSLTQTDADNNTVGIFKYQTDDLPNVQYESGELVDHTYTSLTGSKVDYVIQLSENVSEQFLENDIITGQTSGATATVFFPSSNVLYIKNINGSIQDYVRNEDGTFTEEIVVGQTSNARAKIFYHTVDTDGLSGVLYTEIIEGEFVVGENIHGVNTDITAEIYLPSTDIIFVRDVEGTFQIGEEIISDSSTAVISNIPSIDFFQDGTYVGNLLRGFVNKTNPINDNKSASIRFNVSCVVQYPGYYTDNTNLLNDLIYIHDSHYYQIYSYVTTVETSISQYGDVLKKLLHPSGTAHFGRLKLSNDFSLNVQTSSSLNLISNPDVWRDNVIFKTTEVSFVNEKEILVDVFPLSEWTYIADYIRTMEDLNPDLSEYTVTTGNTLVIENKEGVFEQEEIVGQTSNATANILQYRVSDDLLYIQNISGEFEIGELITGQTSGATANIYLNNVGETLLKDVTLGDFEDYTTADEGGVQTLAEEVDGKVVKIRILDINGDEVFGIYPGIQFEYFVQHNDLITFDVEFEWLEDVVNSSSVFNYAWLYKDLEGLEPDNIVTSDVASVVYTTSPSFAANARDVVERTIYKVIQDSVLASDNLPVRTTNDLMDVALTSNGVNIFKEPIYAQPYGAWVVIGYFENEYYTDK